MDSAQRSWPLPFPVSSDNPKSTYGLLHWGVCRILRSRVAVAWVTGTRSFWVRPDSPPVFPSAVSNGFWCPFAALRGPSALVVAARSVIVIFIAALRRTLAATNDAVGHSFLVMSLAMIVLPLMGVEFNMGVGWLPSGGVPNIKHATSTGHCPVTNAGIPSMGTAPTDSMCELLRALAPFAPSWRCHSWRTDAKKSCELLLASWAPPVRSSEEMFQGVGHGWLAALACTSASICRSAWSMFGIQLLAGGVHYLIGDSWLPAEELVSAWACPVG